MTSHPLRRATSLGLASLLAFQPLLAAPASARPEGAEVVRGDVSIDQVGDTTVIHASDRSIIGYRGFDVGAHETVQFIQPSDLARVLNRIDAAKPSQIDGSILANGQVYIVNPAGVIFGQDAVIDVSRLVATAGSISNEDFVSGVDHFTDVVGPVRNQGQIDADIVELIGRQVANQGTIHTEQGWITMVAGDDVILGSPEGGLFVRIEGSSLPAPDQPGVVNEGALAAEGGRVVLAAGDVYSLALRHSGSTVADAIHLDGGANGLVEVSGRLDASNDAGTGGRIDVLGDKVALLDATLDASGRDGGGTVHVGGDFQGKGELRTAARTYVSPDATIRADATEQGDGGTVIVWADEVTGFYGGIEARGGPAGGDGGFAEVSGEEALLYRGRTDLRAPQGEVGTLLLDPTDITIADGEGDSAEDIDGPVPVETFAGDPSGTPGQILLGDVGDMAGRVTLFESEIEGQSGTVANVILEASNTITIEKLTDSALTLGSDFTVSAGGAFSMDATDTIAAAGQNVQITGATLSVGSIDTSGADNADGDGEAAGAITLTATGSVAVAGSLTAIGGDGADGSGGAGGDVGLTAGGPVSVAGVDASGGDGAAGATVADPSGGDAGTIGVAAAGDITLAGTLRAHGGAGDGAGSDGAPGNIELTASGAIDAAGPADLVPELELAGNAVVLAGAGVGATNPIEIAGSGSGLGVLAVTSSGDVDIDVATDELGSVALTLASADADASIDLPGDDGILVEGETTSGTPDTSTVSADTTTNGADVAFALTEAGKSLRVAGITVASDVQLEAAGDVTQAAPIVANGLGASAGGDVLLTDPANQVDTFAAAAGGAVGVAFQETDGFQVGTVAAVGGVGPVSGINATGNVQLRTVTGDITQSSALDDEIAATDLGAQAAGSVLLTNDANAVTTFAALAGVDVAFQEANGFDVGTVDAVSGVGPVSGINATGNVQLRTVTGDITQSAAITTAGLGAQADAGSVLLGNPMNAVATFAALAAGANRDVAFQEADGFEVGTVAAVPSPAVPGVATLDALSGVTATRNAQLRAVMGDITQTAAGTIAASGLGAQAAGSLLLGDATNAVTTFAADAGGDVVLRDAGGLEVGTVAAVALEAGMMPPSVGPVEGVSSGGDVALTTTGPLAVNAAITASGDVQLETTAAGDITQTSAGRITASGLGAQAAGSVLLANEANAVTTFAALAGGAGDVVFQQANGFQVGTVDAVDGVGPVNGIHATGSVQLRTATGDITQSSAAGDEIAATDLGAQAAGSVLVTNEANSVTTFAALAGVDVAFQEANGFQVGTVDAVDAVGPVSGINATGSVQLRTATGDITQSSALDDEITATDLGAQAAGSVLLTNEANAVTTFAALAAVDVAFQEANGFDVGTVDAVSGVGPVSGINATGNVQLRTVTGGITQSAAIAAAGLEAAASGSVLLGSAANAVERFEASASGDVAFRDPDGFSVGDVAAVNGVGVSGGITGTNVQLQAETGEITQSQAISASGLGVRASHVRLEEVANDVEAFEASASVFVIFRNQHGFVVGDVAAVDGLPAVAQSGITGADVFLQAETGDITQTHAISATGLGARADAGSVLLGSVANDAGTFDAFASGDVAFRDQDSLLVGDVLGPITVPAQSGITGANVQLQADTGDITQTDPITALGLGARAESGSVLLGSVVNEVGTFEASASGDVAFRNQFGFVVGDVAAVDGLPDVEQSGITGANVQLQAEVGDVTQTHAIAAAGLGARAASSGWSVLLGSVANDVDTFEAWAPDGVVAFRDQDGFEVGDVAAVDGLPTVAQSGITAFVVQLLADTGDITQSSAAADRIDASDLAAQAADGSVLLTNAANAVATFAAGAGGADHDVAFQEGGGFPDGFEVGTVGAVGGLGPVSGITATRNVQLRALTGDITQSQPISAAGLGAGAASGSVLLGLADNDVNTFAASAAGSVVFRDVDEVVVGSVAAVDGIGAPTGVAATTGSIELDAPLLLVFDADVTNVTAGGGILLNTKLGDPTEIPSTATIVGRAASLTLTAGGDIEIGVEDDVLGSGQKFTALGDLALDAGGTVRTGDLSALNLDVDAATFEIVRRESGPVLLIDGTLVADGGVDFAADTIELAPGTTIATVGDEGRIFFSTVDGAIIPGAPQPNVVSFFNTIFDPPRPLTTADMVLDGQVLDLVGAGSIQTRLSTQPVLIEEITLGPEFFAKLIDQAKGGKPLWASEIVEFLECSLFEGEDAADVPPQCREYLAQAPDTRLDTEEARKAKERLQAVYGEADAIYGAFQAAAADYLAQAPPGTASGDGFRSFVERSPRHAQARGYLQRIGELFESVNEISPEQADAAELGQWRIILLQDVTPSGLSAEELEDAIGAGRGPTAPTARRLILISVDGTPLSMR